METRLNKKVTYLERFLNQASMSLDGFQGEIAQLESASAVEGLPRIEFADAKSNFLTSYVSEMKDYVQGEKDVIVETLGNFASEELAERLHEARSDVAGVRGQGTAVRQRLVVSDFYSDIVSNLSTILRTYLQKRLDVFGTQLAEIADGLYPKLKAEVQAKLDVRKQAIQEYLTMQSEAARNRVESYLNEGIAVVEGRKTYVLISDPPPPEPQELNFTISEGQIGYSYDIMFAPYFGSTRTITIKEPYLEMRHQMENFSRFCALAAKFEKIKKITLVTRKPSAIDVKLLVSYLEDLNRRLAEQYAIGLAWTFDGSLHAREIRTDDGWIILSDRGLDLYKRPEGRNDFGHYDLALRPCKQTEVHIRRALSKVTMQ